MTVTTAGERVSHREVLLADLVEDGRLDILDVTAEALRNSVDASVAGRAVKARCYFLAYEVVLEGEHEDDLTPPPLGRAA